MFFPLRTDRRLKTTPWMNYGLIAVNLLLFIVLRDQIYQAQAQMQQFAQSGGAQGLSPRQAMDHFPVLRYYLRPGTTQLYQLFTYQFLHASWMHVIGNMAFLYIFGNGVEDRLGKVGYLFFYLAAGVLAGLAHITVTNAAVLGASGSIAGVTGAYLALFPLSNVTIVYWFIVIGAFEVSAMLLILFRVGLDLVFQLMGSGNVAYMAHLTGYVFGFVFGMGLLLGRLLSREPYDMMALIEQRRRRAKFANMTRRGYQPWESTRRATEQSTANPNQPMSPAQEAIAQRRTHITTAANRYDLPEAAKQYVELIEDHPDQVLSQQLQLDVANQLMAEGWYDKAAAAYELFLRHYTSYPHKEQVQLILGLIYARYLGRPDRAQTLLQEAVKRLDGEDHELAGRVLAELE